MIDMRVLTLGIILFWLPFLFGGRCSRIQLPGPPVFEGDTVYLLLDRNSPKVKFKAYQSDLSFLPDVSYDWELTSAVTIEPESGENVPVVFCSRRPYPPERRPWRYCHIERKPLSFLDSIHYYDEDWVINVDQDVLYKSIYSNHSGPVAPPKARILDKGTVSNDSITMYEVTVDIIWFE